MSNDILKPEDCTHLKKRLGRKFDRVHKAYYKKDIITEEDLTKKETRGRKPTVLENPVYWYFYTLDTPLWENIDKNVEDIISGVCNLDHYSQSTGEGAKQLSSRKCIALLRRKELTAIGIQRIINVDKRQAQRYLKALKIMIPFLQRAIDDMLERNRIKYRKLIQEDNLKWGIEYTESEILEVLESIETVLYTPDAVSPEYNEEEFHLNQ